MKHKELKTPESIQTTQFSETLCKQALLGPKITLASRLQFKKLGKSKCINEQFMLSLTTSQQPSYCVLKYRTISTERALLLNPAPFAMQYPYSAFFKMVFSPWHVSNANSWSFWLIVLKTPYFYSETKNKERR